MANQCTVLLTIKDQELTKNRMAELIREKKFDSAIIKIIILALLGLITIYYFGHCLNLFLADFSQTRFLFPSFLALAVFLIVFFFQVVFIRTSWQINLIIFSEALVLTFSLSSLSAFFSKPILIGIFLFFLFLAFGSFSAKREINNTLKINFLTTNRVVFGGAVTAFSLLLAIISGVIFFNFLSQQTFDFEKLITPLSGITEKILKILPSNFIRNILKGFIEQQINSDAKLKLLPEAEREKIIEDALKQMDASAILKGKEAQAFLQGLGDKFLNIPPQTKIYIAAALGLTIFFTLKGVGVVLTWPLTLIAFLFYELLLATNFAKISIEQTNKEVISL